MGQINTNNYPIVSSLADADLLIVENATHGTGTTTPKQLRENAIGTDPLQTTAQTVTGAINEIFEMATDTVVGLELGKMTSFSDGTIVTDIDLHRAPVAGDRILFYHGSAVASPSSLTTYNDGVAVTTAISDFSMTHPAGLTLMKCVALGESLRWQTVQDIADGGYTAGTGISINGTTINNSAPQLGDDIAYSRIDSVTSGALGYFSADADCLVMDFRTDAEPYNGGYTLRLTTTGASFKYAVLQDKAGNNYAEEIPSGSLVLCKSNVSGTGSEADPVVVTVLEIGNTEMAHDVEVLKDICITEKTATGNPITVTDALPYPAVSLSAEIEAIQDLHGYDHPWVGGAGKNKLPMTVSAIKAANTSGTWSGNVYTFNGVTFTILTDSADNVIGIKANGNASSRADLNIMNNTAVNFNGYILTGCPSSGSGSTYKMQIYNQTAGTGNDDTGDGVTITMTNGDICRVVIVVYGGVSLSDVIFYPMIRNSGESATFTPYSNICPISGRTSVTITDVDAESHTATVTVQLGQTVYGGTLNVTTGVMTIKWVIKSVPTAGAFDGKNGSTVNDMYYFNISIFSDAKLPPTNADNVYIKCNAFSGDNSYEYVYQHDVAGIATNASGNFAIGFSKAMGIDTLEKARTWLTNNPLQICYELATPTTIQLTPTDLQMLKGYNRLSSDGGDITLTYKADRLAAIEAALAALQ